MRASQVMIAATLAVLLEGMALACPPPTPEDIALDQAIEARRVRAFPDVARAAGGIAYGVVEPPIGGEANSVGTLRILHVYTGRFRRGQRLRMRSAIPMGRCPTELPGTIERGAYGIVLLNNTADGAPMPHAGFLSQDLVRLLIAEGVIRSARGDRGTTP